MSTDTPRAPRMSLAEARAILNGDRPATTEETGWATGVVLARLDDIDRRAAQVRGELKPHARPVEVVDFLLAQPEETT